MSEIYQNAFDSIRLGIEDFESDDDRRAISAVRNFYAGLVLLGKECLINAAPTVEPMEILASIYVPKLNKGAVITYEPKGQRTVGLRELKERFKEFGLAWPKGNIDKLQRIRNDIEHYHHSEPKHVTREAIALCFSIVEEAV